MPSRLCRALAAAAILALVTAFAAPAAPAAPAASATPGDGVHGTRAEVASDFDASVRPLLEASCHERFGDGTRALPDLA
jgi:hypothetical protein